MSAAMFAQLFSLGEVIIIGLIVTLLVRQVRAMRARQRILDAVLRRHPTED